MRIIESMHYILLDTDSKYTLYCAGWWMLIFNDASFQSIFNDLSVLEIFKKKLITTI